jgi:hypothetical protein
MKIEVALKLSGGNNRVGARNCIPRSVGIGTCSPTPVRPTYPLMVIEYIVSRTNVIKNIE